MFVRRVIYCTALVPFFMLAGCATSISEIAVDDSVAAYEHPAEYSKTVHIRSVADDRVFNPETPDASVPSTEPVNDTERDRSIGRKRNTFGKALGSINLPSQQGVKSLVRKAVEKAYVDNGYKVVEESVTGDTQVVDVSVKKFWAWMQPGFWALKLNADMAAEINMGKETLSPEVRYGEYFQTGMESNYKQVLDRAYSQFIEQISKKISESLKAEE